MKFRAQRAQIALLLTPGLAIFALFTVYPIIRLFWMSLCDMSFASMLEQPFAGLANYREVFRDPTFWTVFVNSLVYTAVTVPGQMALGLFIAILLSGIKRFSVTFRVINYLPVVTSWVIASLVFRYIFNTEGLLNSVASHDESNTDKKLKPIEGNPPDLLKLPVGCSFADRCRYAMKQCKQMPPPRYTLSDTHRCKCWRCHPDYSEGVSSTDG